jgi:hypothetical protein
MVAAHLTLVEFFQKIGELFFPMLLIPKVHPVGYPPHVGCEEMA